VLNAQAARFIAAAGKSFLLALDEVKRLREQTKIILRGFSPEATSKKNRVRADAPTAR